MTIFSNDPIRVKITLDDLWNLTHSKGIDSCAYPSPYEKDEYYIKFACSDLNPHNPQEEKYRDDIDKEISNLNVRQDHIREFSIHKNFNPFGNRVIETILDENVFKKENRYDLLLDKARNVHRLKNGKFFGIIDTDQI